MELEEYDVLSEDDMINEDGWNMDTDEDTTDEIAETDSTNDTSEGYPPTEAQVRQGMCYNELKFIIDTYIETANQFTEAVQLGCRWIEDINAQSEALTKRNYSWTKLIGFLEGLYMALSTEDVDAILKEDDVRTRLERVPELHEVIEHIRQQADRIYVNTGHAYMFHPKLKPLFLETSEKKKLQND